MIKHTLLILSSLFGSIAQAADASGIDLLPAWESLRSENLTLVSRETLIERLGPPHQTVEGQTIRSQTWLGPWCTYRALWLGDGYSLLRPACGNCYWNLNSTGGIDHCPWTRIPGFYGVLPRPSNHLLHP